jgi:hypothetical protein
LSATDFSIVSTTRSAASRGARAAARADISERRVGSFEKPEELFREKISRDFVLV